MPRLNRVHNRLFFVFLHIYTIYTLLYKHQSIFDASSHSPWYKSVWAPRELHCLTIRILVENNKCDVRIVGRYDLKASTHAQKMKEARRSKKIRINIADRLDVNAANTPAFRLL